jgi:alpha-glucosidase
MRILAAFTPVMRTHEGNRPTVNHQFDADGETIAFFSRFSRIHTALLDYILPLAELNSRQGIPVMRPTFFHDPGDEEAAVAMHQYMLGQDMLIAPVVEMGAQTRKLYLPKGEWEYLWNEQTYQGGQHHEVPAPMGQPPVFIRRGSEAIGLIPTLRSII